MSTADGAEPASAAHMAENASSSYTAKNLIAGKPKRTVQSPASLSLQMHQILREKLGFTGVIITDDLAMDGVRNFAGDTEIAVRAVLAGNDLLCCTDFEVQIPAVLEAVAQGEIAEERIDESVLRILELKASLAII